MTNLLKKAGGLNKPSDDGDIPLSSQAENSLYKSRNSKNSCLKPCSNFNTLKKTELNKNGWKDYYQSRKKKIIRDAFKSKKGSSSGRVFAFPKSQTQDRNRSKRKQWRKGRSHVSKDNYSRGITTELERDHRDGKPNERRKLIPVDASQESDVNKISSSVLQMTIKEKKLDTEDEDEVREKVRQSWKLQKKRKAYQNHLYNWIARENRKAKEYQNEEIKANERRKEESEEARKLEYFLKNYDDERDDNKYFKGHSLARRLQEREEEIGRDVLDHQKEKEELYELKNTIFQEGYHLLSLRVSECNYILYQITNCIKYT